MESETQRQLSPSPLLPWDGPFAYDVMKRFGITPASTSREVLDASFDMDADTMSDPLVSNAWEALRTSRTRLMLDFFCLDLPPAPKAEHPASAGAVHSLPWSFLRELSLRFADSSSENLPEPDFQPPAALDESALAWEPPAQPGEDRK